MRSRSRWGPRRSLLALSPIFIGAPWLAYHQHLKLPEPLAALTNPTTKLPQISEQRILGVAKHLSEGIGYRTVGTYEHALADEWMVEAAEQVKRNCERIVLLTGRKLECEVWRQEGSGNHRFDMMGKRLYKTYVNLSNIVVRISDGTQEGKEHALLINAHLDSTLPSPGAADDALAVGVMLDCMRVLVETPDWSPRHAIIFLFNHAEESLQDGSHLFSTQHPIASTVRAVVNLEAAGTTGREILFQATSEQMIDAYSHVPRPYGTIFANEIFSSGILLSDTDFRHVGTCFNVADFRQFETYLNVTGLDMALIGNSYLYHMRKDLVENIGPGVAQHMAENVLALSRYLSSADSPLPSLTAGYTTPTTVFFTHLNDTFFVYSFSTAKIMYAALFVSSFFLVWITSGADSGAGFGIEQGRGCFAVIVGMMATLLAPNVVAFLMTAVLDKGMSWFKNPLAPLALYGPPSLLGALTSQYLVGDVPEESVYSALLLIQSFVSLAIQLMGVGSAAMFFLAALPIFVSLLFNFFFSPKKISLWTYAIGQTLPLLTGSMLLLGSIELFVPLTGRIGAYAPADNIIATIIAALGALSLPLVLPLAHRFGQRALLRGMFSLTIVVVLMVALFAMRVPFDKMHQKRLFILHQENITTQEHHLHVAAADGAPGFESLVNDIAREFGRNGIEQTSLTPMVVDDDNTDWDPIYPFSAFLKSYKFPLPVDPNYASPWSKEEAFKIYAIDHGESALGSETRNLTVKVDHPGLIWTVLTFDAHVLQWSLDDNPPNEFARHRVKEASFYAQHSYSFDVVVRAPSPSGSSRIHVNFVGLQEKGLWPAKKALRANGGVAMELFEKLDAWLEVRTRGTVDALLMGCVTGAVDI